MIGAAGVAAALSTAAARLRTRGRHRAWLAAGSLATLVVAVTVPRVGVPSRDLTDTRDHIHSYRALYAALRWGAGARSTIAVGWG